MKKIIIFGAGGFGREVKMLIDQINANSLQWEFLGYVDEGKKAGDKINNYPVLGGVEYINNLQQDTYLVFAVGDPVTKAKLESSIKNPKISYGILIHPNVYIGEDDVHIGEGSIICAGNIITVNIHIGRHVILNLCCTIGHDTVIQDYCSLMPGVNISGEVLVERLVYIGTGAKIINQLTIGVNSTIGAGAVVSKSLPSNCVAVGIPAKPIKYKTNE